MSEHVDEHKRDKKRKADHSSSSSDSSDSDDHHKHRSSADKDARKAEKKARKAEKKALKKKLKEAKKLLKSAENANSGSADSINEDHYFAKNSEFRVWLLDKKMYFDDLSGDEQRHYFKKFVIAWNNKSLPDKFYKGIDHSQLEHTQRTKFTWGFSKRLNEKDTLDLESARDSVDTQTFHQKADIAFAAAAAADTSKARPTTTAKVIGPAGPPRH